MKYLMHAFMMAAFFVATPTVRAEDGAPAKAEAKKVMLCGKCGEIKGSDDCCKAGATKCGKCSMIKDSPGCCKMPAGGADAELCAKCGEIKGTDDCCKKGAVKCDKCGLIKGSAGCCKMEEKKDE